MSGVRMTWFLLLLQICPHSIAAPAQDPPPASGVVLSVGGEVPRPVKLTAPEFGRLPRPSVRAKDHEGKEANFEGVPLVELLKASGVKFGHDLRGPALAAYLAVEAS